MGGERGAHRKSRDESSSCYKPLSRGCTFGDGLVRSGHSPSGPPEFSISLSLSCQGSIPFSLSLSLHLSCLSSFTQRASGEKAGWTPGQVTGGPAQAPWMVLEAEKEWEARRLVYWTQWEGKAGQGFRGELRPWGEDNLKGKKGLRSSHI